MAKERVVVVSRVRIEKYDENMELFDVHESKVPEIEKGILPNSNESETESSENE